MVRKRNRIEIIFNMLKIVQDNNNSIKPTPLLRYSNISSQSFNEYYLELISKGFIREQIDKKGRKYITLTDKGYSFLLRYREIIEFIDEFEL